MCNNNGRKNIFGNIIGCVMALVALASFLFWLYKKASTLKKLWDEMSELGADVLEEEDTLVWDAENSEKLPMSARLSNVIRSQIVAAINNHQDSSVARPQVAKTASAASSKAKPASRKPLKLSARQKQILNIIEAKGGADMQNIANRVKGVSTRTLRRDMTKLEDLRLVRQVGTTRNSVYQLS